jgi:hypothetical protein
MSVFCPCSRGHRCPRSHGRGPGTCCDSVPLGPCWVTCSLYSLTENRGVDGSIPPLATSRAVSFRTVGSLRFVAPTAAAGLIVHKPSMTSGATPFARTPASARKASSRCGPPIQAWGTQSGTHLVHTRRKAVPFPDRSPGFAPAGDPPDFSPQHVSARSSARRQGWLARAGVQAHSEGRAAERPKDKTFAPVVTRRRQVRGTPNWVPTSADGQFELRVRFYKPEKPLFDKTWTLPDIEKVSAE